MVLQGPVAQQLHEEEVKTLISEAVQAKQAEHAAGLLQLQQGFEEQIQDCEADLTERDRYCSRLWCVGLSKAPLVLVSPRPISKSQVTMFCEVLLPQL